MKKIITIFLTLLSFNLFSQDYKTFKKLTMQGVKEGLIYTPKNDTLIPAEYDFFKEVDNGYVAVKKNGKYGVIDTSNKIIIPFLYDNITVPSEGRLFVEKTGKYALCDLSNHVLTGYIYDGVGYFSEGIALVIQKGKAGYINKLGTVIVPIKYSLDDYTLLCKKGVVVVYSDAWESLGTVTQISFFGTTKTDVGMSTKFPSVYNNKGQRIYQGVNNEKTIILPNGNILTSISTKGGYCNNADIVIMNNSAKQIYRAKCNLFEIYSELGGYIKLTAYGGAGIITFDGVEKIKPAFQAITDFKYSDNKLARVLYYMEYNAPGSPRDKYFYVNKDFKCESYEGISCPE